MHLQTNRVTAPNLGHNGLFQFATAQVFFHVRLKCHSNWRESLVSVMDHMPCRGQREAIDIDHPNTVFIVQSMQGMTRDNAYAQTTGNSLLDRFIAAQLEPDMGSEFHFSKVLICHHSGS